MSASKIQWTEFTWNPVTGCSQVSAGCKNCYAKRQVPRMKALHPKWYANGFEPTCHEGRLDEPFKWTKPRHIFVCSMSDLFHEKVPDSFIDEVFVTMMACEDHYFQLVTKRADRMAAYAATIPWPVNVGAGVTIESNDHVDRADALRSIPAPVRAISAEPLLGPLTDLDLTGIDHLIVGGESGSGWRQLDLDWARELRDRANDDGVAFFFKQHAGLHPKKLGNLLDGRVWEETPALHPERCVEWARLDEEADSWIRT